MNYIKIAIIIISVKAVLNLSKLLTAKFLRKRYLSSFSSNEPSFTEYIPQAKRLFIDAGLDGYQIPVAQPIGYGRMASFPASIIDNLDSKREDFVSKVLPLFDELVGIYRMRFWDSFSIRYWIESVFYLPSKVVAYFGGKPNGLFTKILQLLYWFITPWLIAFREDVYRCIAEFISKL